MTIHHLIIIAIALYIIAVLVASVLVFAALYMGDDDRHALQPGYTTINDDD